MSYGRVANCATVLLEGRNQCYEDVEWRKLGKDKLQGKERKGRKRTFQRKCE